MNNDGQMAAVFFHETGAPDVLAIQDMPIPAPGHGEVLIKIAAAGVNFADTVRRSGAYYPVPTPLPYNPGHEVAGTVVKCGPGVDEGILSAAVVAVSINGGGYAQYMTAPAARLLPWPSGLDASQAVALAIQGLTAMLMLTETAKLMPGESIFVPGATGGVGQLAVQFARAMDAGHIIAGVGSQGKMPLALALGADSAVDYSSEEWDRRSILKTVADGVDIFLDASGGHLLRTGCSCLAIGGRAIIYGMQDPCPDSIPAAALIGRAASAHGFFLEAFMANRIDIARRAMRQMGRLVQDGLVEPRIHARLPLASAQEAHRIIEQRENSGKVVLIP